MHILKTAGTSLIKTISSTLRLNVSYTGFDRSLFGNFNAFDSIAPELSTLIKLGDTGFRSSQDRFVAAHMSLTSLRKEYPDGQFISIFREPVTRILSHWLYWRGMEDHNLSVWGEAWAKNVRLSRCSLNHFLSSPQIAAQTDNLHLRMLLWPHPCIPNGGFIEPQHDEELIDAAIRTLSAFDLIGVIDEQSFEDDLSYWLRRDVRLPRENDFRCSRSYPRTDLPFELSNAKGLLAERARLDIALWKHAIGKPMIADHFLIESLVGGLARYNSLIPNCADPS